MIYDGRCGFCYRSMVWFLSFDGLGQIRVRDFRTNPSPVVSDARMEKALHLVLPDGRTLAGFEAYRHVVLRVPGSVVADSVLLHAGVEPHDRPAALQLGRRQPQPPFVHPVRLELSPRRGATSYAVSG